MPEASRKKETKQIFGLAPSAECSLQQVTDAALAGAYLRQSEAAGFSYDTIYVSGRSSTLGLSSKLRFYDRTGEGEEDDTNKTVFEGSLNAAASERAGFGNTGTLPNVYDVLYTDDEISYQGPVVLGPGAVGTEIPSTGAAAYAGKIALEVITQNKDGSITTATATGDFAMQAGYGSKRATFRAAKFDAKLPFDTLGWSNLFMCATRIVSSGKGIVSVQSGDTAPQPPFKTGRDQAAFTAVFESSQFAPAERPGPPISVGGVLVIQSDIGTITGVFLSAQAEE